MPLCTIEHGYTSFKRGAKEAAKRHRGFSAALQKVLESIESDPMTVGDRIDCNPKYHVRKVRIGSPQDNLPPRAGYRLLFQVINDGRQMKVRLLDCFYKPHQASINAPAVNQLISLAAGAIETEIETEIERDLADTSENSE